MFLWNFNPHETVRMPEDFHRSIRDEFIVGIYGPIDVERLVGKHRELASIWGAIPRWIMRADIGRLLLIYEYGGFYFDADCLFHTSFLPEIAAQDEVVLFTEKKLDSTIKLGPRESKSSARKLRIANYALGAREPGRPFYLDAIKECVERMRSLVGQEIEDTDVLWASGPDLITSMYHRHSHQRIRLLPEGFVSNRAMGSWRR